MSILTAPDGARIFYKDWGRGQPILFSHGWPLSADAWDNQLLFFGQSGFRVIAHDRRGHGRSDQTWHGNDINQYADDLALLIETLDLRDLILVGHAISGGTAPTSTTFATRSLPWRTTARSSSKIWRCRSTVSTATRWRAMRG